MKHVLDINVPRSRQFRVALRLASDFQPREHHSAGQLGGKVRPQTGKSPPFCGETTAFEMPNYRHRALNFH
jgi:hypothetical protein